MLAAKMRILADIDRCGSHHADRNKPMRHFIMLGGGFEYYWATFNARRAGIANEAEYNRVAKLNARYRRFCQYCLETLPGWTAMRTIYYADNSTYVVEIDKWGNTRERMVIGPGGDACY